MSLNYKVWIQGLNFFINISKRRHAVISDSKIASSRENIHENFLITFQN